MLSPFGESTKSIYSTHVGERLFKHKKGISRPEKTAADALVSDLPSDTLRWIKKRRNVDCKQKVVLSHHRERQLREIFNGIDVEKRGEINIAQLEEAIGFVESRIVKIKGLESVTNLKKIFRSMDDNGDGNVDFHEFTSGSSKSMLDSVPPFGIDIIYQLFVQFGQIKQRDTAVQLLTNYTQSCKTSPKANPQSDRVQSVSLVNGKKKFDNQDSDHYYHFKTMFGADQQGRDKSKEKTALAESSVALSETLSRIVEEFVSLEPAVSESAAEKELRLLHDKLKASRKQQIDMLTNDPDYILQIQRVQQEKLTRRRYGAAPCYGSSPTRPSSAKPATFIYSGHLEDKAAHEVAISQTARRVVYDTIRNNSTDYPSPKQQQQPSLPPASNLRRRPSSGASIYSSGTSIAVSEQSAASRANSHQSGNTRASSQSQSTHSVQSAEVRQQGRLPPPSPAAADSNPMNAPSLFVMSSVTNDTHLNVVTRQGTVS